MWKKLLGNLFTYIFTTLFVMVFLTVIVSGIFFTFFVFSNTALAETTMTNGQCLQCHSQKGFSVVRDGKEVSLITDEEMYGNSVHGSNNCITCHQEGVTNIPHKNPVYGEELKKRVSDNCQSCHSDDAMDYQNSIHGQLAEQGKETAYCSDCHGSHDILKKENINSPTYRLNVSDNCVTCHDGQIKDAYNYSFHGTAVKLGYMDAATCTDCHGNHNILPADNPKSMVSSTNRPETCASCHQFAGEGFANGDEHVTPMDKDKAFPLYLVWKIFILLIVFDIIMNGTIIPFELVRQLRSLNKSKKQSKTSEKGLDV